MNSSLISQIGYLNLVNVVNNRLTLTWLPAFVNRIIENKHVKQFYVYGKGA